jgi:hypothetical protein
MEKTFTSQFTMTRPAHKRDDYATRSGSKNRAAAILFKAANTKPTTHETEDGYLVREWTKSETKSYCSPKRIAEGLAHQLAWDVEELLEVIPLSAIKTAYYKGWIVKAPSAPYLLVTRQGAAELDLPRKDRQGRLIRFYVPTEPTPVEGVGNILKPLLPTVAYRADE